MKKRTFVIVLLAVVVVSAAGVSRLRRDRGPALPTAAVTTGTFIDYLQLRGEIRPIRSVTLTAPSSGSDLQIVQLAKNGAPVDAGDVVVQFDTTLQQRTLEQKQSELKQAESEIQRAEAELRRREQAAKTDLEQARGAAARARVDLAKREILAPREGQKLAIVLANADQKVKELTKRVDAERASAEADVTIARQRRDKARFDVTDTERIIAAMTIRAPSPGSINLLPNYRASAMFSSAAPEFRAGDRAYFGAPIAELPDLSTVQLSCHIDEEDRARVQTGRAVLVQVDAIPNHELNGTVAEISMMAKPDFRSWPPTRNFDVIITLQDTDAKLRPGMSAGARIQLEHLQGVLLVPSTAIFQRGRAFAAYVVNGSSVDARTVAVLRRGRDQIAIAGGLREGERVATKDPEAEAHAK